MTQPQAGPLHARIAALEALFRQIAGSRMAGIPVHPALQVQAIGFEAEPDGACAVGVLVSPWFMNLMRLPLEADGGAAASIAPVGVSRTRVVGNDRFDFVGAHEPGFGAYESCSLFSPMFDFADHAAAAATAQAVVDELRKPPPPAAPRAAPVTPPVAPSRRALLFGRGGRGGRVGPAGGEAR